MKIFLLGIGILFGSSSFAMTFHPEYKNGQEVCQEHRDELKNEWPLWVEVPAFHGSSEKETTLIYTYTKKAFNPTLPSVLFFTGGPGVSSRSTEFALENFNVIFMEQRGISCSRPKTKALFLNPHFYSSIHTAIDAWHVMKAYGLKKISVYGHSYGTIAATLFASFYPQQTRSLVLEGVVFSADESLWRNEMKESSLQSFFDSLPPHERQRILELSETEGIPATWFSKVANMMLYLNDGLSAYRSFLEQVLTMDTESFKSFISTFYRDSLSLEEEFHFGDVTMGMIGCQEMSMAKKDLSMLLRFEREILVRDNFNHDLQDYCIPLNLQHQEEKIYHAKKHPLTIPTFYLLGETDGATSLSQGLAHYEEVAKGKKQAFILKKGGHLPLLDLLKNNRQCHDEKDCANLEQNRKASAFFEKLLLGQEISAPELLEFNQNAELEWKIH